MGGHPLRNPSERPLAHRKTPLLDDSLSAAAAVTWIFRVLFPLFHAGRLGRVNRSADLQRGERLPERVLGSG